MRYTSVLVSLALFALIGCSGSSTSKIVYAPTLRLNDVMRGDDCYDAAVLVAADLATARRVASTVLRMNDSSIKSEDQNSIMAQRNRHIGIVVGSGGEELFLTLKEVEPGKTFITIATKTGFVGGAGQKAWSCQIAEGIVQQMAVK